MEVAAEPVAAVVVEAVAVAEEPPQAAPAPAPAKAKGNDHKRVLPRARVTRVRFCPPSGSRDLCVRAQAGAKMTTSRAARRASGGSTRVGAREADVANGLPRDSDDDFGDLDNEEDDFVPEKKAKKGSAGKVGIHTHTCNTEYRVHADW